MKTLILFLFLFSGVCYSQDKPLTASDSASIFIAKMESYLKQIQDAELKLTIGDGKGITKNANWIELVYILLNEERKKISK